MGGEKNGFGKKAYYYIAGKACRLSGKPAVTGIDAKAAETSTAGASSASTATVKAAAASKKITLKTMGVKKITVKTKKAAIKTSNKKVVKVKKKKVGTNKYKYTLTAQYPGTATVTYKKGGKTVKAKVTVKAPTVSITSVKTYDSYVKLKFSTKYTWKDDVISIYRSTDGKKWKRLNGVYAKTGSYVDKTISSLGDCDHYYYKICTDYRVCIGSVYTGKDYFFDVWSDVAKTHGHTWEAVYETVHHDAETHYEYEYEWHVVDSNGTDWGTYDEAMEAMKQMMLVGGATYSWHEEYVVVDSWLVVDEEAYDEEVLSYYTCSCGATKDAD